MSVLSEDLIPPRIVFVGTKFPENIGSAARICHNFGIREFYLVNPQCEPFSEAVFRIALNGASLLSASNVVNSIEKAISDCSLVFATADHKVGREKITDLNDFKPELHLKTAILFGREDIGFKTDELAWCNKIITISTPGKDNVLNLSHSLSIVLWKLFSGFMRTENEPDHHHKRIITTDDKINLLNRYKVLLNDMGKSKETINKKKQVMQAFLKKEKTKDEIFLIQDLISFMEYQQNQFRKE